jgi:hypothetical protein
MGTIAANVDNDKLSDAEFREFIRNTLPIVLYDGAPPVYNRPVRFSSTDNFGCVEKDEDDVYTIEEFKATCACHGFIDDDGYGHPVKNGLADESLVVRPSRLDRIPESATHIVWYNR